MKLFRSFVAAALLLGQVATAQAQIVAGNNQPNFKNLIDNGAFNVNQRGAAALTAASITGTAKYLQDRWAAVSGTSTTATLTNATSGLPTQFTNAAQVQRNSGQTGVVKTCLLQEIPTIDITGLAGQPVTLSFWASAGANFSAASSALVAQVTTGTSSDEGLATWLTGFAGAASAIPTANATVTLTTGWQRFAVTGTLAANTTEAVVNLCWTPVGTAGTSDLIQVTGAQLEQGTVATNFEWRPYQTEFNKVSSRYTVQYETEGVAAVFGTCQGTATSTLANCYIAFPLPMAKAPAITYTAGAIKATVGSAAAAEAVSALTVTSGGASTFGANLTATSSSVSSGAFGYLGASNASGGGIIQFSADF